MVAPLIAVGARIVGKRAAAKTAARRSAKGSVQNAARHTASASPRTPSAYARSGRTVPQPFDENLGVQNAERYSTEGTARTSKAHARRKQAIPHRDNLGEKATRILRNRILTHSAQENQLQSKVRSLTKTVQVGTASAAILSWYTPFYLWLQLPFAILALLALAYEGFLEQISWGLLNYISPGEGLFYIGMGVVLAFGFVSMMVAAATYTLRYISVFSGSIRLGGMILCMVLHVIPFIPGTGIWVVIVTRSYK